MVNLLLIPYPSNLSALSGRNLYLVNIFSVPVMLL
jgi:hypothetical protein